jgi:hypothetical protein
MQTEFKMRPKRGWRNRAQGRKGNAFVEFSLCALPLFALFFGTADVAMAVFLKSMLESGVRDGVRFGITYGTTLNGASCGSMTDCMITVVQNQTLGFLEGANASLIQVNYYQPTDLTVPLTAEDCDPNGSKTMKNDTQSPARQLRYMNQPGNLIEVRVSNYPYSWMVPLPNFMPGSGMTMSSAATDVLQGLPVGTLVPPTP